MSYFVLLLLAGLSFVLKRQRRWARLPLFVAFALLSLWHARSIPFFAIVAGPILAASRLIRAGVHSA